MFKAYGPRHKSVIKSQEAWGDMSYQKFIVYLSMLEMLEFLNHLVLTTVRQRAE